jgi:bis(5'-nucleosidyl)-tetraphosphatase
MKPIEKSCGVITVLSGEGDSKFLLLKQSDGSWTYPKGHVEAGETQEETALRELQEETGITKIKLLDFPIIREEYEINFTEPALKINEYFIGLVKDTIVTIQVEEIEAYAWVSFDEAMERFEYEERKESLSQAQKYLEEYEKQQYEK